MPKKGIEIARIFRRGATAWVMLLLCCVMLTGCRSGRGGVSNGGYHKGETSHSGSKHRPAWQGDYSHEVTDPMARDLVEEARGWLGTPYRYGGEERSGTDCSGLVMRLYEDVCAMKLPRTTTDQRIYCVAVPRDKTRVGDLLFFGNGGDGRVSHVGLYIGRGEMIHASSSRGVTVSSVESGYWNDRFQGTGRVMGAQESWAQMQSARRKAGTPESRVEKPSPAVTLDEFSSLMARNSAPAEVPKENPIDELDAIISEKVDSIFSSQFMD